MSKTPIEAPAPAAKRVLRFTDLKKLGVCPNRERLRNLIVHHDFPPGFWTGRNSHNWHADDVEEWLKTRPSERPAALKDTAPE